MWRLVPYRYNRTHVWRVTFCRYNLLHTMYTVLVCLMMFHNYVKRRVRSVDTPTKTIETTDEHLPDDSEGAVSNRSVRLVVHRMCGGRLCGVVGLLLSVEKLLRGAGLLVVADRTIRRALHQRHWHPGVSARADHSHNSTSVTVSPRILSRGGFRSHLRRNIIDDDDDDQRARWSTDTVGRVDAVKYDGFCKRVDVHVLY